MSYHILHITSPNCSVSIDRGLLICKYKDETTNIIPLLDLKAVVVASFGVNFTNSALARLLENNVVILHCNHKYYPVGYSVPLEKIVRSKVFYNQISRDEDFERNLWKKVIKSKVLNQEACLRLIGNSDNNLLDLINKSLMNEANIARQYFKNYFLELGYNQVREHQNAQTFENICLNYGYAVINSLIYRSIIVHGLIASLGIHHLGKYKSTPLVYDLMEPYRPFVDYCLYQFSKDCENDYEFEDVKQWAKYFANCIKNYRTKIDKNSYKIVDSIDIYIEKIAKAYEKFDLNNIFLPNLNEIYLHIDNHRNREYEE